jgi:MFS transporter, DHA1 family, inner membrane transport protein
LAVAPLPRHGRSQAREFKATGLLKAPVLLALAGCFFYMVNLGAYWTYIERIGAAAHLSISAISNTLGFSSAASIIGLLIPWWFGNRRGVLMPLALSALATVASLLLLVGTPSLFAYVLSAVVYGNAWNLLVTYQYGVVHEVDTSGSGIAASPGFQGAGQAVGPAIAALFVTEHNHSSVIWVANVSVMICLACFVLALRLHRRAARVQIAAA